jgi:hypothetical protein
VLSDEAYVAVELHIPWANYGPTAMLSPTRGAIVSVGGGASPRAAARAAWRCSMRAWRERWPERLWRRDVEAAAAAASAGTGASSTQDKEFKA